MSQVYVGTKLVEAYPIHRNHQVGYEVKYKDGYVSWSPKETFEEANIALGNIGHLPEFVQRLYAEKAILDKRVNELRDYLSTIEADNLNGHHYTQLKDQLRVMADLANIYGQRILSLVRTEEIDGVIRSHMRDDAPTISF